MRSRFMAAMLITLCTVAAVAQAPRSPQSAGFVMLAPFQMTGTRPGADRDVLRPVPGRFNFLVPVKVDNLALEVTEVRVECRVYAAKPTDWMGSVGLVGSWSETLPVGINGGVMHTVLASFDPKPPAKLEDGKYYQCGMRLLVNGSPVDPDRYSTLETAKAKGGVPFLAKQDGLVTK